MKKFSLGFIAFLQALGLVVYCGLVGLIFWKGNTWFGPMNTFWGPVMVLVLFIVSALICGLIGLGYPFLLFWEKKQPHTAIKLVFYITAWLILFVLVFLLVFALV